MMNGFHITATHGCEFEAQPVQDYDPEIEAPFRLVRANGRPPFRGRACRLFQNKPNLRRLTPSDTHSNSCRTPV